MLQHGRRHFVVRSSESSALCPQNTITQASSLKPLEVYWQRCIRFLAFFAPTPALCSSFVISHPGKLPNRQVSPSRANFETLPRIPSAPGAGATKPNSQLFLLVYLPLSLQTRALPVEGVLRALAPPRSC